MSQPERTIQPHIGTVSVGGRRFNVSVVVSYDGIEYTGRLWFSEEEWDDDGLPDRGVIPGRTRDEVVSIARELTADEMLARYKRAAANKRRYLSLRAVIEEFLRKVRYLNQVAISMRAGLIDLEGAAQEIDVTEHQMHELIRRLRDVAGIEEP